MTNEQDLSDLLREFIGENRLNFEGDNGVENLETVAKAIGYRGHGYRYGTPLEEFLSDNPGAQRAILDWLGEQHIQEWIDNIESELPEREEEVEEHEGV